MTERCLICGKPCAAGFVYVWPHRSSLEGGASFGRLCESHTLQEVLVYEKEGRQLYLDIELLPGRR